MTTSRATPLLMLPGTLCDERVFSGVVADLSRPIIDITLTGASSAADMARIILEEAPPIFALCGFSLGAIVSLEMVAQAPARIERLALIGCNPRAIPPDRIEPRRAAARRAHFGGTAGYIAEVWDASVPSSRRDDPILRSELEAMAADTPFLTFRDQIEISINRVNSVPRLGEIRVPTLVACGAEDQVVPPELAREIATHVPSSRLAIVEEAGHYVTLDQPEIMARLLAEWLRATADPNNAVSKELP